MAQMLCQRFQAGQSWRGNDLTAGGYLAADHCAVVALPSERHTNEHVVRHGYAVELRPHGQWYFFHDIAPAAAFGRSACMSPECILYGIYRAAHEMLYCAIHEEDERVLHVAGDRIDWIPGEAEHLERFVRGVREEFLNRGDLPPSSTSFRAKSTSSPEPGPAWTAADAFRRGPAIDP
jgi:hypothetical protein